MSEKAIAVGGAALVSLAAFTFSKSPDSSAASEFAAPEPIIAPLNEGDGWTDDRLLPAAPEVKREITCALPAWPNTAPIGSDTACGVEIFPAPIEIRSAVVAEALDGIRTFRLDRRGAAELVAHHLVALSEEELVREGRFVSEARDAELALARGVPSRDTAFLSGVNNAITQALDSRSAGETVEAADLAETIAQAFDERR
ncbi:MAG: hypothetical protein RL417_2298 [Pseudomonadota bacterium]|jgi:hypothetical protein